MVRLKCLHCGKHWKETKKQEQSEEVRCPKCNTLHHIHSKPINPPKAVVVPKKKKVDVPIPQPLKPYESKVWQQRNIFNDRFVSFTPDKENRKKTRKVERV